MKTIIMWISLSLVSCSAMAQQTYQITYHAFRDGALLKQDPIIVIANAKQSLITRQSILEGQGRYSYEEQLLNKEQRKLFKQSSLSQGKSLVTVDSTIWDKYTFEKLPDQKKILNYTARKAKTSVNSNAIEIWYSDSLPIAAAPNEQGLSLGLVLEYTRNGNSGFVATSIKKLKEWPKNYVLPEESSLVDPLTYQDLLWKSKFIQLPIFKDEQICFQPGITSDSVLRFAEGTVILKKIKVPQVDFESQAFIELVEKSNGDAYDRTGSVFLIAEDQSQSFLDGMKQGMNTLPKYDIGDGKDYLGMIRTSTFSPVIELMRFFTPFGVSHFNERLTLKNKTWQDSVTYRQDISEYLPTIAGKEVWIGTYIGNYDKGGHKVNLEMTIHPGYSNYAKGVRAISLFNTTNIMEMGGQTYPTLFAAENGLEVEFELQHPVKNARLRYVSTGHGGWWDGDEFVPKTNTILWNNKIVHEFTPWRTDCGSYRLYNPVSGNFDSGLSSSDLSRSNWCPGTITQPIFIPLGNLEAGKHRVQVKIPQGAPQGDSMSFWNVSGALLFEPIN